MASLLSVQNVTASYGSRVLFEGVSLAIADGDRLGMIGPNGAGKSTLLRILAGSEEPDSGVRSLRSNTRLAMVPQAPAFEQGLTIDAVLERSLDAAVMGEASARIAGARGRAELPGGDTPVDSLSGGWRKRLAIACALVREPDVILLDEPTNHLDLEGVLWLERLLRTSSFAALIVTHDRMFLENVASRVTELNKLFPEGSFTVEGNYSEFLLRREDVLLAQARHGEMLANKVRREVEWLRRGPRARATKSKSRIEEAGRLIDELAEVRTRQAQSTAGIDFAGSGRRSRQLMVCKGIGKAYGGRTLFSGLELALSPGTRLGVLGLNGCGKTTLLRILAGELEPDRGSIERADALVTVMFDQAREQLDPEMRLRDALAPLGGDSVSYRGRQMHVTAWARRFLFHVEQLDVTLGRLSGGEQARVLVARLMLRPADVLILDEPTNDLDLETLGVLEESLAEFPGALVLVTHDRYMLDRISTELLALDGQGGVERFADYAQWETAQRRAVPRATAASPQAPRPASRGLSYKEKQELEGMEAAILAAESDVERLDREVHSPEIANRAEELAAAWHALQEARARREQLWARWSELDARSKR
ncbi:MAG: ABC-F family ATP-binding cassette domain-containing protein [Candidatus Wallbacteria bacterium]|nr:ABC-F family ATP-binding cassette domain-containing protein [Candidatus Wallbacteria bacterium]